MEALRNQVKGGEEEGDEGFVREGKGLLALSPGGTSKGPQDVGTGEARETRDDMLGEKVNLGSKVTPRMRGFTVKGGKRR